jgi:hypothetical protein
MDRNITNLGHVEVNGKQNILIVIPEKITLCFFENAE